MQSIFGRFGYSLHQVVNPGFEYGHVVGCKAAPSACLGLSILRFISSVLVYAVLCVDEAAPNLGAFVSMAKTIGATLNMV